jgi:hypothetical protein
MDEIKNVSEDNVTELIRLLNQEMFSIPMSNSQFQMENFVIAAQITPERAWRQVGLQLQTAVLGLRSHMLNKKRNAIKYEKKLRELKAEGLDELDRQLIEMDLEEIRFAAASFDKSVADSLHECNYLFEWYKKFPKYTREQFEAGELTHYMERSKRQVLNIQGGAESIYNIVHDLPFFANTVDKLLTHSPEEIRALMTNRIPEEPNALNLLAGGANEHQ